MKPEQVALVWAAICDVASKIQAKDFLFSVEKFGLTWNCFQFNYKDKVGTIALALDDQARVGLFKPGILTKEEAEKLIEM